MSAVTVGADFHEGGVRFSPDRLRHLRDLVAHLAKAHPVDDVARDIVAFRAIDDFLERSRALDRCAHGEEVVFANENDRQLVERGQIERFVEGSLVDRPIAEEAKRDPVFTAVLRGEGHPGRERNVRRDDGVPAVHVIFAIEKMHRSAQPARAAGGFAEKLRHAGLGRSSARERVRVIAVGGDQIIIRPHRRDCADYDRFLADIEMAKATDLLRLILLTRALLETPDQQHQREHFDFVALLRRLHGRIRQGAGAPPRRVKVPGCGQSGRREKRGR